MNPQQNNMFQSSGYNQSGRLQTSSVNFMQNNDPNGKFQFVERIAPYRRLVDDLIPYMRDLAPCPFGSSFGEQDQRDGGDGGGGGAGVLLNPNMMKLMYYRMTLHPLIRDMIAKYVNKINSAAFQVWYFGILIAKEHQNTFKRIMRPFVKQIVTQILVYGGFFVAFVPHPQFTEIPVAVDPLQYHNYFWIDDREQPRLTQTDYNGKAIKGVIVEWISPPTPLGDFTSPMSTLVTPYLDLMNKYAQAGDVSNLHTHPIWKAEISVQGAAMRAAQQQQQTAAMLGTDSTLPSLPESYAALGGGRGGHLAGSVAGMTVSTIADVVQDADIRNVDLTEENIRDMDTLQVKLTKQRVLDISNASESQCSIEEIEAGVARKWNREENNKPIVTLEYPDQDKQQPIVKVKPGYVLGIVAPPNPPLFFNETKTEFRALCYRAFGLPDEEKMYGSSAQYMSDAAHKKFSQLEDEVVLPIAEELEEFSNKVYLLILGSKKTILETEFEQRKADLLEQNWRKIAAYVKNGKVVEPSDDEDSEKDDADDDEEDDTLGVPIQKKTKRGSKRAKLAKENPDNGSQLQAAGGVDNLFSGVNVSPSEKPNLKLQQPEESEEEYKHRLAVARKKVHIRRTKQRILNKKLKILIAHRLLRDMIQAPTMNGNMSNSNAVHTNATTDLDTNVDFYADTELGVGSEEGAEGEDPSPSTLMDTEQERANARLLAQALDRHHQLSEMQKHIDKRKYSNIHVENVDRELVQLFNMLYRAEIQASDQSPVHISFEFVRRAHMRARFDQPTPEFVQALLDDNQRMYQLLMAWQTSGGGGSKTKRLTASSSSKDLPFPIYKPPAGGGRGGLYGPPNSGWQPAQALDTERVKFVQLANELSLPGMYTPETYQESSEFSLTAVSSTNQFLDQDDSEEEGEGDEEEEDSGGDGDDSGKDDDGSEPEEKKEKDEYETFSSAPGIRVRVKKRKVTPSKLMDGKPTPTPRRKTKEKVK